MADDLQPGQLGKSFTVICFRCYHSETLTRGAEINGRRRLYLATVTWSLRNVYGWTTRHGKWMCPRCRRNEEEDARLNSSPDATV